ncbi:alanine racemase [Conexibacter sp. W3-3-2]|uniref:alanine racemase n=1 Tax=Conexibacter sp. W3-3-2 TaxID=2675227 RepID=UPI002814EF4A|nr:alanine racemase [Conexibacter sp. W3-3-2]
MSSSPTVPAPSPDALRARYDRATAELEPPLAIVDLDALEANARDLVARAGGRPIRVASKSVRCRAILDDVLARDGFAGVMAFTLPEALWLAGAGHEDVLVAYPTADRHALAALAADPVAAGRVTIMVDDVAQLGLLPVDGAYPIRVALDLDASWRPLGGRVHLGVRRSPVHDAGAATALARAVVAHPGARLVGLMSYEAQIAGVGDAPPSRLAAAAIRLMQRGSARELARRRAAVVAAVRAVAPLEFVNGGGTGSLERTARETAVTELAAGSGLYAPTLFDTYAGWVGRPAALFALPVVRRPAPGIATVLGGGYHASGAAGADRLPTPVLPAGLRLDGREGAGEVQTPLLGAVADRLAVGDRVWFRHTKAGELCERFDTLHLVRGDVVERSVPTYRGEGRTFA